MREWWGKFIVRRVLLTQACFINKIKLGMSVWILLRNKCSKKPIRDSTAHRNNTWLQSCFVRAYVLEFQENTLMRMVSPAITNKVLYYVAVTFLLVIDSVENLIKTMDPLPIKYWHSHISASLCALFLGVYRLSKSIMDPKLSPFLCGNSFFFALMCNNSV